jgi:hypothetical protein
VIGPSLARLLCAASLSFSACSPGTPKPPASSAPQDHAEAAPVQARTEQLQDAGFVVIETACGIEVAIQVGTRSIRGRIPIVGFASPDANAALWEAPQVTVELFSLRAEMIGAANLQGAALFEPFRSRELNFSRQESPGSNVTALALPAPASKEPELALDHWQLERREQEEPHRLADAQRAYVVVALDKVVVALLTHAPSDDTHAADRVRQTFGESLRVEDRVPDLAALGGVFAERDARDPKCKEDPQVVVATKRR